MARDDIRPSELEAAIAEGEAAVIRLDRAARMPVQRVLGDRFRRFDAAIIPAGAAARPRLVSIQTGDPGDA